MLGNRGLKVQASAANRDSVGRSLRGRIEAEGYTMAQLALKLSEALHQPVQDTTSVDGKFDFKLEWMPDEMQARLPSPDQTAGNNTLEISAGRQPYELPQVRQDYAGVIVSLAKQEQPDTSAYSDPEIVYRVRKYHHAGFIVKSRTAARVKELLESYAARFVSDFVASQPVPDKPTA